MNLPVTLSIVVFFFSLWLLFKRKQQGGVLGLLYLALLHGVVGLGFVYMGFYIGLEVGEVFAPSRYGGISESAYWSTLAITVVLLVLNQAWYKLDSRASFSRLPEFRFQTKRAAIVVLCLVPVYMAGLQFRTLGVGLELAYVLPLRLNGIIEAVTLFLLPFVLAVLFLGSERRSWAGLGVIVLYALYNLVSFGSKFAAIFPIVVFSSTHFVCGRFPLKKLAWPA